MAKAMPTRSVSMGSKNIAMIKAMASMDLRVLGLSQVQAGSERWYPERTPSPFYIAEYPWRYDHRSRAIKGQRNKMR
jgi:hypothetical protein